MNAAVRMALPSLLPVFLFGCFTFIGTGTVEEGIPLDDGKISRIVVDETTRSEVFQLLGTPHSIFHGMVEFVEEKLLDFYLHKGNRYLSTIDNRHYAMLYRFGKHSGKVHSVSTTIIAYEGKAVKIRTDELLLLLDSQTHIVTDIAYRKESSP